MHVYTIITTLGNIISSTFASDADMSTAVISRIVLFEVVRISLAIVQYEEEVLEALLVLLMPDVPTRNLEDVSGPLCDRALADGERFRPYILDQAFARYPYELSPLLRILTALATTRTDGVADVVYLMDQLKSFTVQIPDISAHMHWITKTKAQTACT